jgi:endonuclease IV
MKNKHEAKLKVPSSKLRARSRPRIGFHAPIRGGLHQALVVAKDTGCDTVQLFSRNPRGWMAKPLLSEDVELFRQTRKLTKISPVLIHCNYLVNLAAADEALLIKSIGSFREEVERGLALGVDYLVVHPGSARGACEADGIALCAESLKIACQGLDLWEVSNPTREHRGAGRVHWSSVRTLTPDHRRVSRTSAWRLFRHRSRVHGWLRYSRRGWVGSVDSEDTKDCGNKAGPRHSFQRFTS